MSSVGDRARRFLDRLGNRTDEEQDATFARQDARQDSRQDIISKLQDVRQARR